MRARQNARYCHGYKSEGHHHCVHNTQNLIHLSPLQKVFMYIVSFALILAGRHMGSFMFSIWQMNINTVIILANSVNGRGKEGLGQSICYI